MLPGGSLSRDARAAQVTPVMLTTTLAGPGAPGPSWTIATLLASLTVGAVLLPSHWLPKAGSENPLGNIGLSVSGYWLSWIDALNPPPLAVRV